MDPTKAATKTILGHEYYYVEYYYVDLRTYSAWLSGYEYH